jgi:hypothetical protein
MKEGTYPLFNYFFRCESFANRSTYLIRSVNVNED